MKTDLDRGQTNAIPRTIAMIDATTMIVATNDATIGATRMIDEIEMSGTHRCVTTERTIAALVKLTRATTMIECWQ